MLLGKITLLKIMKNKNPFKNNRNFFETIENYSNLIKISEETSPQHCYFCVKYYRGEKWREIILFKITSK